MNVQRASLIAVSSTTHRRDQAESQDAAASAINEPCGVRAVLVADGLGSQAHAGYGAKWAVESASEFIQSCDTFSEQTLRNVFAHARARLNECAADFSGPILDRNQSFGTTLLIAAETDTSLLLGYVGNGAMWHLRGQFGELSENWYVPWHALNYLNPHSVQDKAGRESLYRLLSIADDSRECTPTIIKLEKDQTFGDIVIICTDGIYSNDQLQCGRYRDGSVWVQAEPLVLRCFDELKTILATTGAWSDPGLSALLSGLLTTFRTESLLDDDASVGVIITGAALNYHFGRINRASPT